MQELNLVALSNGFSEARNSAHKTTPQVCFEVQWMLCSSWVFFWLFEAFCCDVRLLQRNAKPRTPKVERGPVSVRRSSRVANIPAPDYREVSSMHFVII